MSGQGAQAGQAAQGEAVTALSSILFVGGGFCSQTQEVLRVQFVSKAGKARYLLAGKVAGLCVHGSAHQPVLNSPRPPAHQCRPLDQPVWHPVSVLHAAQRAVTQAVPLQAGKG